MSPGPSLVPRTPRAEGPVQNPRCPCQETHPSPWRPSCGQRALPAGGLRMDGAGASLPQTGDLPSLGSPLRAGGLFPGTAEGARGLGDPGLLPTGTAPSLPRLWAAVAWTWPGRSPPHPSVPAARGGRRSRALPSRSSRASAHGARGGTGVFYIFHFIKRERGAWGCCLFSVVNSTPGADKSPGP